MLKQRIFEEYRLTQTTLQDCFKFKQTTSCKIAGSSNVDTQMISEKHKRNKLNNMEAGCRCKKGATQGSDNKKRKRGPPKLPPKDQKHTNNLLIKKSAHSSNGLIKQSSQTPPRSPTKRKQGHEQNQEQNPTVWGLCKVCGDTQSKHIHYGGRSCRSCRAFFRRSVERYQR